MDPPFIGELRFFGFSFAPQGWVPCDGRLLSIQQNQALFSLLGTNFGGNGQTTFAIPDLRGRLPLGQGGAHQVGEVGGAESVALTIQQIPAHTHVLSAATTPGGTTLPGPFGTAAFSAYAKTGTQTTLGGVQNVGNGLPHNNMQPYLVGNWCIAFEGAFPPRN
jgi:microcystin-dependent protein